jgi:3-dehydroquinate synthase
LSFNRSRPARDESDAAVVKAVQKPAATPTVASPSGPDRIRQSFSVSFEYDVIFTRDAFALDNRVVVDALSQRQPERRHKVLAIFDEGFATAWPETSAQVRAYFQHHADHLALVTDPVSILAGEAAKNDPGLVGRLHTLFHEHHMDRHSFVLVVGGGGVQDAAGYAAATAHRGIRTIRMPTTVLGQNDSGVGVKNGINAFGNKNFIGTFVPPYAVINDFRFLERLPHREAIAGMAEAVKVSLIRDESFFGWIEANAAALAATEPEALAVLIRRCAELHLRHIGTGGDPFERGSARPLDFGHWAAHKLEALTAHEIRHGEAVAIGVVLDSRYSVEAGLLPEADFLRIERLVARLGLPRWHDGLVAPGRRNRPALFDGLDDFREHLGGDLTITLLRGIGQALDVHEMHEPLIEKALTWMRARSAQP